MPSMPAVRGDALAVLTGEVLTHDLIRAGEALEGKPVVANHVVVLTRQDHERRCTGPWEHRRRRTGPAPHLPGTWARVRS